MRFGLSLSEVSDRLNVDICGLPSEVKVVVHFGGGNLLSTLNFIWRVFGLKKITNKVSFSGFKQKYGLQKYLNRFALTLEVLVVQSVLCFIFIHQHQHQHN